MGPTNIATRAIYQGHEDNISNIRDKTLVKYYSNKVYCICIYYYIK